MTQRYAIVTTISTFRHRYAIPIREGESAYSLQDLVTCNAVEEFSQLHLGEQISDALEMSEDQMLELFDRDNEYLRGWSRERKIAWVNKLRTDD